MKLEKHQASQMLRTLPWQTFWQGGWQAGASPGEVSEAEAVGAVEATVLSMRQSPVCSVASCL